MTAEMIAAIVAVYAIGFVVALAVAGRILRIDKDDEPAVVIIGALAATLIAFAWPLLAAVTLPGLAMWWVMRVRR